MRAARVEAPTETARQLASCGGSGPDVLVLTLSRIPQESDLRSAICDWFSDEPWRVRLRSIGSELPRAEQPSAGELRVTILRASESSAQLNVTAPPRDEGGAPSRWLERVALSSGFDDVGIEVIAQTVHSTAQANHARAFRPAPPLAAARAVLPLPVAAATAVPAAAAPPDPALASASPAAAEVPAVSSPSGPLGAPVDQDRSRADFGLVPANPLGVHTALGYQFHARGGEPLTHGPSLRVELDWLSRTVVLASFVRGALFTSSPVRSRSVEIGLEGMGLGAGLAASLPWKNVLARLALGANVEVVGISVNVYESDVLRSLGDGRARPRLFLTSETGVAARLGPIELGLEGLLRWQTSSSHYDVLEGSEPHTLVRAWRLQPGAAIEVAYVW
ncbi:MAG: hypothetical protein ABI895_22230 [Deltaproteobacteria bacterium]